MIGRAFSVMFEPRNREEDMIVLVLVAANVVGFGTAAFFRSMRISLRIVGVG